MDKILVEVYVPVAGMSYDVFIPRQSMFYEVQELIEKSVREWVADVFIIWEDTALCFRDTGEIVNINVSVEELGLKNGSKLMLI